MNQLNFMILLHMLENTNDQRFSSLCSSAFGSWHGVRMERCDVSGYPFDPIHRLDETRMMPELRGGVFLYIHTVRLDVIKVSLFTN